MFYFIIQSYIINCNIRLLKNNKFVFLVQKKNEI